MCTGQEAWHVVGTSYMKLSAAGADSANHAFLHAYVWHRFAVRGAEIWLAPLVYMVFMALALRCTSGLRCTVEPDPIEG